MKYRVQCLLIILTVSSISTHRDNYYSGFEHGTPTHSPRIASYITRSQPPQSRERYYHKLKRHCPALYDSLVEQTTYIRDTLAALLTSQTMVRYFLLTQNTHHDRKRILTHHAYIP